MAMKELSLSLVMTCRLPSSVPLESVIADDVSGGGILRLLRRRVRRQSMHKVNGLVFNPWRSSPYTLNGCLPIGHGVSPIGRPQPGRDDVGTVFVRRNRLVAPKSGDSYTSGVGIAFREISLLSTRAIRLLIAVVRISAVPNTSSRILYRIMWFV